jgi:5'-3' exonuclease
MGVRGLMLYCRQIQRVADMSRKGLSIGIDAFSLIFLFRENRESFKKYLQGLLDLEHTLIFVMDKRAQKEKKEVVDERKETRREAKADATELTSFTQTDEFAELDKEQQRILNNFIALKQRDAWCLYPEYVKWLKVMIGELGISLVFADEEADSVLADGNYDVVISGDSDLLILGVKALWIPHHTYTLEILREDFLNLLGLQGEQLYQLAFMCGCDVQPRKIVDIQTAVSLLRFYGSIHKVYERLPTTISIDDINSYMRLKESVWNVV